MSQNDKMRIRRAIYLTNREENEWDYWSREPLHLKSDNLEIHLVHYHNMTDPVALFRPQVLRGFYGYAKVEDRLYEVVVIIGSDEGLRPGWAPILIGTRESIHKYVQRNVFQQIFLIIPPRYKMERYPFDKGIEQEIEAMEKIQVESKS